MVAKIVGAAAYLSILALIWKMLIQAEFSLPAVAGAFVLFFLIGAFATYEPHEWQKVKPEQEQK